MVFLLIFNALVAFCQEYKADNIVDSLKRTLATRACVVRNGRIVDIGTEEIVIGDIIRVTDVSSRRFEKKRKEDFDANIPFRAQSLQQMAG
jgi:magnesium-transporting ATPase (P-type)